MKTRRQSRSTMFKRLRFKHFVEKICNQFVQSHVLTSYIFSSNNTILLFYDNNSYHFMRVDYRKKYKVLVCELMFIISHIRFEQDIKGLPKWKNK